jgi:capsular exopolysaccharide synthesis family protein
MEEEIDIKEICLELWRKKWTIFAVTFLFLIAGLFMYGEIRNIKKSTIIESDETNDELSYVAETTFLVSLEEKTNQISSNSILDYSEITVPTNSTEMSTNRITVDSSLFSTYSDLLTSKTLLNKVITNLGLDITTTDLKNSIALLRNESSNLLKIYVNYSDRETALNIANASAEALIEKIYEIYNIKLVVIDEAEILSDEEIENLEVDSDTLETTKISNVIETNTLQTGSIKKIALVTVLGFVLSCAVIVIIELFSSSVKNQETLEKALNLKTLAKIKNNKENVNDEFKLLRVNINECKTILVTSSDNKVGKSFVAMNLAKSFAKLNKKVLLIDLTKNESELLKKYDGKGLSDFLDSQDKFVEKYANETEINNLSVLLAGKKLENMTELLESSKFIETLSTIERLYDEIIIDSANALESANTLAVAKVAKYSILVCEERKTKIENVVKAKTNIEDIGGIVIGTVLNKSSK